MFKELKGNMYKELRERMNTMSHQIESINEETNIRKNTEIVELKSTTEIKNSLEGFNIRFEPAEKKYSMNLKIELLRLSGMRNTHTHKGMKKNKQNLKGLWDKMKHVNLHTVKVSKGGERQKRAERIF